MKSMEIKKMQVHIPREKSQKIINLFQLLSNIFPEAMADLIETNKRASEGITIEVTPMKLKRTRPQENYYRKYCAEFARFCGMTPDEMHEEMLCQTFGSTEHATKFGMRRRPQKRSGDAARIDYSELVETLCRVAAEMGYYVPPAHSEVA
jgi:hypothetical protein